jgi:hypothetical protein
MPQLGAQTAFRPCVERGATSRSGLVNTADTTVPVAPQAITLSTAILWRNRGWLAQRIYGFFTVTRHRREDRENGSGPHTGWCASHSACAPLIGLAGQQRPLWIPR